MKMNIPQKYIVGHSIGGQVVTEFALSYPSMVKWLVVRKKHLGAWKRRVSGNRLFTDMEQRQSRTLFSRP
ncbi:alpha/beta fold hydrolase [Paenibacillus polymyxa]|uniref:alpha/beta fold hydrolase n=2 Tax=Paenibacillus polymyxa TaxID=1406 RepID=UPI0021E4DF7B|nr:alpha/beta hydrolase [Paenibacillus polymyxa]